MNEKELLEIVAEDEDQYMEFKGNFLKPAELAEYMMLFANADGGTIFLGIDDKSLEPSRKITEVSKKNIDFIQCAAKDNLIPPLEGVTYEIINCPSFSDAKVLVIAVPDSKELHQTKKGLLARRRGSEREAILLRDNIGEIVDKASLDFDAQPLPGYSIEDISKEAIITYRNKYLERNPTSKVNSINDEELLLRKKAIVNVDGELKPTLTGILFFGEYLEEAVSTYRVDFIQFAGIGTTDSANGEIYLDRKPLSGTLPEIIEETERFITDRIATRGYLQDGFERQEVKEYPLVAYREAIINALCHRDYTIKGSAIQIRLFSNRLEIESPGKLAGQVTIENIEEIAFARNRHIANLLSEMGYVEQLGIGIDLMIKTMHEAGLEPPEFKETNTSFVVTLINHALLDKESLQWLEDNYKDIFSLSGKQRNALAFVKKRGRIHNSDYRQINSVDRDTATQDLKSMVTKGVIEQIGRTSGASYKLIDIQALVRFKVETIIPQSLWKGLNNQQKRIIKLFEIYERISTKEITEKIGIDRRGVQKYLSDLCEVKILERKGKSISDPNAYYIFNKEIGDVESQQAPLFLVEDDID